eukprot:SAG11_NODE_1922_length_4061_cov_13.009339_1_plen_89_part_10
MERVSAIVLHALQTRFGTDRNAAARAFAKFDADGNQVRSNHEMERRGEERRGEERRGAREHESTRAREHESTRAREHESTRAREHESTR